MKKTNKKATAKPKATKAKGKEAKAKATKKAAPKKKETKLGKALIKGLKQAKKHQDGKLTLRTTTYDTGRPIVKDPPEKSTIPDYEGSREQLITEIKAKLLKMKEDTISSIRQRVEESKDQDDQGTSGDEGDMAQALAQQNIQKSLSSNDELKLRQIEVALEKIAKGTYGICIDTEEEIEARRLLANPFAVRSIAAQEDIESAQRRTKMLKKGGQSINSDEGPEESSEE